MWGVCGARVGRACGACVGQGQPAQRITKTSHA